MLDILIYVLLLVWIVELEQNISELRSNFQAFSSEIRDKLNDTGISRSQPTPVVHTAANTDPGQRPTTGASQVNHESNLVRTSSARSNVRKTFKPVSKNKLSPWINQSTSRETNSTPSPWINGSFPSAPVCHMPAPIKRKQPNYDSNNRVRRERPHTVREPSSNLIVELQDVPIVETTLAAPNNNDLQSLNF